MARDLLIYWWPLTSVAAFAISLSTGQTKQAIWWTAIGGSLLFSLLAGAARGPGWLLGLFGMSFIPSLVCAAIGAALGAQFRPMKWGREKSEVILQQPLFLNTYSQKYGISESDVRELVSCGTLPGVEVDGQFMVEDIPPASYSRSNQTPQNGPAKDGRPMS